MAICSIYEVHYTITKSSAKDPDIQLFKEVLVEAASIREAEDKFIKVFVPKRGMTYEVTAIIQYRTDVIR